MSFYLVGFLLVLLLVRISSLRHARHLQMHWRRDLVRSHCLAEAHFLSNDGAFCGHPVMVPLLAWRSWLDRVTSCSHLAKSSVDVRLIPYKMILSAF
jgi:hypothetical protein